MRRTQFLLGMISAAALASAAEAQSSESGDRTAVDATQQPVAKVPVSDKAQNAAVDGEDIIVTASRRNETVRNTPTAVSAYAGERLRDQQILSLPDLIATSPNIQISSFTTFANIAIRGVGNSQLTPGADPGVALHADSVYLAQSGLAASTFLDVNRVEVLRGPQGTLFGRNATGGAVNIVPNYPTAELSAGFDASLGADPLLVRGSAFVSGPLDESGNLRGRVSVQTNSIRGYTRNLAANGPDPLDNVNTVAARGQLQWVPSDQFQTRLLVEYQHEADRGSALFLLGTPDPTQLLPQTLQGAPRGDIDERTTYANQGARRLTSKTANLTTDISLGAGDLKLLVSYNEADQFVNVDGDGTAVNFTNTTDTLHSHQYYAEAIYASDASQPFNYIIGSNFFNADLNERITVPISFIPIPVELSARIKTTSYAFFGHIEYEFLSNAKVFGGLRFSNDRKSADETNNFIGALSQQKSWSRITYEGGLSYRFNPSITGYAKYSTGYKGGGFSGGSLTPPFNPETNAAYEIGLKGSYLNNRLTANIAAFHMKYDNLQVAQVIGVTSAVVNAAKATIDGVEIESTIRPIPPLRIELSGAYLNARFDSFNTQDSARPTLGILNLSGNLLPQAPHFTASVGGYYTVPVATGELELGGRFDWKSHLYFTEFNIPVASQDARGKIDMTLKYKNAGGRWTASLFALNATNAKIKNSTLVVSALLGSLALGSLQPGRQIGVSVSYHF